MPEGELTGDVGKGIGQENVPGFAPKQLVVGAARAIDVGKKQKQHRLKQMDLKSCKVNGGGKCIKHLVGTKELSGLVLPEQAEYMFEDFFGGCLRCLESSQKSIVEDGYRPLSQVPFVVWVHFFHTVGINFDELFLD